MPLFETLEKPMAYVAFSTTVLCLMWKSSAGISWLPGKSSSVLFSFQLIKENKFHFNFAPSHLSHSVLGPAIDNIFVSSQEGKLPQYPRRPNDEEFWNMVYFLMYGVFGFAAQYSGLQISVRQISIKSQLVWYCRLYGLFHLVIGLDVES
jgi:hypothetical protein